MLRIILLASAIFLYYPCSLQSNPRHYKIQKRWISLENASFRFDCSDKAIGFYADVEYNCQIFHMCDPEGRRMPHSCANETGFNQEFRICDWLSNFNCSDAPKWYYLNELTYATEPSEIYDEEVDSK